MSSFSHGILHGIVDMLLQQEVVVSLVNFTYKPKQYVLCSQEAADRVIEVNKNPGIFLLTESKS